MCEDSEILKLQAEMEFERGNFNRHINDMTAQNKSMYSDNMKLKLALAESNASWETKKRVYDSLILWIKEDSKKISEPKTDR